MRIYRDRQEWVEAGYIFCEDCQHFEPNAKTPNGIGVCGFTKNRTVFVPETQKHIPHMQGLAPDTQKDKDYIACYPTAPRRCTKYAPRLVQST